MRLTFLAALACLFIYSPGRAAEPPYVARLKALGIDLRYPSQQGEFSPKFELQFYKKDWLGREDKALWTDLTTLSKVCDHVKLRFSNYQWMEVTADETGALSLDIEFASDNDVILYDRKRVPISYSNVPREIAFARRWIETEKSLRGEPAQFRLNHIVIGYALSEKQFKSLLEKLPELVKLSKRTGRPVSLTDTTYPHERWIVIDVTKY